MVYGFRQMPEPISSSKRFTDAEKTVISKVFDMMWKNKDSGEYADMAWPSDEYLSHFCGVSVRTVSNTKTKCKKLGLFTLKKRPYTSTIWILREIPNILVDEYRQLVNDWEEKVDEKEANKVPSNKELAEIIGAMNEDEVKQYFKDNPLYGKLT